MKNYLSNRGKATVTTLREMAADAGYEDVYKPARVDWESVTSIPFTHKGYILRKYKYKKVFRSAKDCYNFLESLLMDAEDFVEFDLDADLYH